MSARQGCSLPSWFGGSGGAASSQVVSELAIALDFRQGRSLSISRAGAALNAKVVPSSPNVWRRRILKLGPLRDETSEMAPQHLARGRLATDLATDGTKTAFQMISGRPFLLVAGLGFEPRTSGL